MGEPPTEAEPITPSSSTTAEQPKIVRQSMIQRLKSLLGALGQGAKSAEDVAPYHIPEPPESPKENPPPQAFPTGS